MKQPEPKLAVLLTLWRGWRPCYELRHVRAIARMLRRYLHVPHKLVLLTEIPTTAQEAGVDEVREVPPEPRGLRPVGEVNCFRRLRFFDPNYTRQFGTPYVMSVDLDSLLLDDITADIDEAMRNPFGFAILKGRFAEKPGAQRPYNGALFLVRVGAHPNVWNDFHPVKSPIEVRATGWAGSDQVWMSLKIRNAPTFGPDKGFYFLGQFLQSSDSDPQPKMLNYAGPMKPWSKLSMRDTPELYEEWLRFADPREEKKSA
jgi:hypothetical protein